MTSVLILMAVKSNFLSTILKWILLSLLLVHVKGHVVKKEIHLTGLGNSDTRRENVQVKLLSLPRKKRDVDSPEIEPQILEIKRPNSTLHIHLISNDDFLAPNFTFTVTEGETSTIIEELSGRHENCFYMGTVVDLSSVEPSDGEFKKLEDAALSACGDIPGGFTGVIPTQDGYFLLAPKVQSKPSKSDGDNVERPLADFENNEQLEITYTMTPIERPKMGLPKPSCENHDSVNMSAPLGSQSGDDDVGNLATNLDLDNSENSGAKISTYAGGGGEVIHNVNKDGQPHVEWALFCDQSFYEGASKQVGSTSIKTLKNYMVNLAQAVALMYLHPSWDIPTVIILTKIEIFKKNPAKLNTANGIMSTFLNSWCDVQFSLNKNGANWDHATLMTFINIGTQQSDNAVGYAKLAGMCTASISCSLVETKSFFAVNAIAHEIAHSLGVHHDGEGANTACAKDKFVMAAAIDQKQVGWSSCSNVQFKTFLNFALKTQGFTYTKCLKKPKSAREGSTTFTSKDKLPGQKCSADEQCTLKWGKEKPFSVTSSTDFKIIGFEFCKAMYCKPKKQVEPGDVALYCHPPLDGTPCGSGLWCRGGDCCKST